MTVFPCLFPFFRLKERQICFGRIDLIWANCYRAKRPDTLPGKNMLSNRKKACYLPWPCPEQSIQLRVSLDITESCLQTCFEGIGQKNTSLRSMAVLVVRAKSKAGEEHLETYFSRGFASRSRELCACLCGFAAQWCSRQNRHAMQAKRIPAWRW